MIKRFFRKVVPVTLLLLLGSSVAFPYVPSYAAVSPPCFTSTDGIVYTNMDKTHSYNMGVAAVGERYDMGGNCFSDNHVQDWYEGVDCSGLVFRAWMLSNSPTTDKNFYWRDYLNNRRNGFSTKTLKDNPNTPTWGKYAGPGATGYMDAVSWDQGAGPNGHVFLVLGNNGYNSFTALEARSPSEGINIWLNRTLTAGHVWDGYVRRGWAVWY